ncbi:glycosyl hydrolase [Cohnella sp. 56]|uniref:glycosyl hydrolase n=1 Tax=Cohnella sp. 56 TaxID=3113722 RepID=UPI0030E8AAF8
MFDRSIWKRLLACAIAFTLWASPMSGLNWARAAAAVPGSSITIDFEEGIDGWSKGYTPNLLAVSHSEELSSQGNEGSLKLDVEFKGGDWEEANPQFDLPSGDLSAYESISYDLYVPQTLGAGSLEVQTILNGPWAELGTRDAYPVSKYFEYQFSTVQIHGISYAVFHRTDDLLDAYTNKQKQLFIRIVGRGITYSGPIYVDNVVLTARTVFPEPPQEEQFTGGTIFEAEAAALTDVDVATAREGYSGTGYVTGLDNNEKDNIAFSVNAPEDGNYPVTFRYAADAEKTQYVLVDGNRTATAVFPATQGKFKEIRVANLPLKKGMNSVTLLSYWGYMDVDYMRVLDAVPRPDYNRASEQPVNPYASAQTKALMKFLNGIYGSRILSGGQWSNFGEFNYIYALSGKLPAIKGFDFLEKDMSIKDAIEWFNYGGIVTYSWHWRAPMYGNDFYTGNTLFDVRRAVTPGTPEYDAVLKDIDTLAGYIKKLSDAHVPILFRPLHEAQGGWFWWGAHGPEPAKRLYGMIYDRLTNVYKLDNIIWEWTTGTSETASDWYPGDTSVDIVGPDIYFGEGENYGPLTSEFDKTVDLVGGKKMVGLLENGSIPDPALLSAGHTPWLYFNTWGGPFVLNGKYNTEQHLIDVYTNPFVLTLQDLHRRNIYGMKLKNLPPCPTVPVAAPVPAGYKLYEAEKGELKGANVGVSNKGFSGDGYTTDMTVPGSSVTIKVDAPTAGSYHLLLRYSSPFEDHPNDLYVNGKQVRSFPFLFHPGFTDDDLGVIQLNRGVNEVSIVCTTGYIDIDAFLIKRADNAKLADLKVSGSTKSFKFDPAKSSYQVKVDKKSKSFVVTPKAADPYATVTVNGVKVSSGKPGASFKLNGNHSQTVKVVVTAQDGKTKQSYSLVVAREFKN